jgi:hypothetical protein
MICCPLKLNQNDKLGAHLKGPMSFQFFPELKIVKFPKKKLFRQLNLLSYIIFIAKK